MNTRSIEKSKRSRKTRKERNNRKVIMERNRGMENTRIETRKAKIITISIQWIKTDTKDMKRMKWEEENHAMKSAKISRRN